MLEHSIENRRNQTHLAGRYEHFDFFNFRFIVGPDEVSQFTRSSVRCRSYLEEEVAVPPKRPVVFGGTDDLRGVKAGLNVVEVYTVPPNSPVD